MSHTLPDAMAELNRKTKLRCAEIVDGGEMLWMGLEIKAEIQKGSTAKARKGKKRRE